MAFFRKTDYFQECVLMCTSRASRWIRYTPWLKTAVCKSSAHSSHCCQRGTCPWASRKHLNSKPSASTSPPKLRLYHYQQTLSNKYIPAAWDGVKAGVSCGLYTSFKPQLFRRSAAVERVHSRRVANTRCLLPRSAMPSR